MDSVKDKLFQEFVEAALENNIDDILMVFMRDYKGHISKAEKERALRRFNVSDKKGSFVQRLYRIVNSGNVDKLRKIVIKIVDAFRNWDFNRACKITDITQKQADIYNSWVLNLNKVVEIYCYYSNDSIHDKITNSSNTKILSHEWIDDNRKEIEDCFGDKERYFLLNAKFVDFCNKFDYKLNRKDMYKNIVRCCYDRYGDIEDRCSDYHWENCIEILYKAFGDEFLAVYEEMYLPIVDGNYNHSYIGEKLFSLGRKKIYEKYIDECENKLDVLKDLMGVQDDHKKHSENKRDRIFSCNRSMVEFVLAKYGRKVTGSFIKKMVRNCLEWKSQTNYLEICKLVGGKDFEAIYP